MKQRETLKGRDMALTVGVQWQEHCVQCFEPVLEQVTLALAIQHSLQQLFAQMSHIKFAFQS